MYVANDEQASKKCMDEIARMLRETKEDKIVKSCKALIKDLSVGTSKKDMVTELSAILAKRRKKKEEEEAKQAEGGGDGASNPNPPEANLVQAKVLN